MDNIFIIGNGFDLAHGLKTSYSDFANNIVNEKLLNNTNFPGIINANVSQQKIKERIKIPNIAHTLFENRLFYEFYSSITNGNWSDIEKSYFKKLMELKQPNSYYKDNPKKLNSDLNSIKENLIQYLKTQNSQSMALKCYTQLFNTFNEKGTLILNFNYTNTIKLYETSNSKIINIHGELENENNKIIFGYAASDEEQSQLLDMDDNEYLINIKRLNYNFSLNERNLIDFLENCGRFEAHVLGHSLGLSDKQILNTILGSNKLKRINIFHHNDNYFDQTTNIYRILKNSSHKVPILQYPLCHFAPQKENDEKYYGSFKSYCQNLKNNQ